MAPAGTPLAGTKPSNDNTEPVGVHGAADATWIRPRAGTQKATARLRIAGGGQEREVVLDCAETTIGRDDRVTIPIKDPLASRTHALLVCDDNEFWIEDKNSLNGTQVNGRVIKRQKLENNDRIVIGDTTFTFVDGTRQDDMSQTGRAR
jgi:pSer/pThr/pTyr-binding forkhead associated (FHA) protein